MTLARIVGTGSYLPKQVLTNKDLENIVDTTDEWITRRSGISERRICSITEKESTTYMATRAAWQAMEMAGVSSESLDMIVMGTLTADRQTPSGACMVQEALDARNAAAFDVSAGCSGFLYALTTVDNAIRCRTCRTALVLGAERLSSIVNWEDRNTCVLLADGAGAVVVSSSSNGEGILTCQVKSDGRYWDLLYSSYGNHFRIPEILGDIDVKPFYLTMDGHRLFKMAINSMSAITETALKESNLTSDDIDLVIPHQANIRIIQGLAKSLNVPMSKVYTNIDRCGNTSSATIPIALDEANREGLLKKGDNVLMVSFGSGLTWGASILKWAL